MKDVPSHMMKFIRKITKKNFQEAEDQEVEKQYRKSPTSAQNRQNVKKEKIFRKKEKQEKAPKHLSVEEKNKKEKKRTPIIKERSHKNQLHL